MNYPMPFWSLFTPTMPFSDYMNYWNRYSQEERIKRMCEELWKLIQAYQLLTEAVNDLDARVTVLEGKIAAIEAEIANLVALYDALNTKVTALDGRVTSLEERMTALENKVNQLIADLPGMIQDIINTYIDSPDFTQKVTDIVNGLITGKMDKVTGAVTDDIATYGTGGQVKDSGKKISTVECTYDSLDTTVPTSKAVYRSLIRFVTDTNMDNIPLRFGNYYLDNNTVSWTTTVAGLVYATNCIKVDAPINNQNIRIQSGLFKNASNPTPVLMERIYNITGASWGAWTIISHEYIQSTVELAQAVSVANPNALVYVPEVV